MWDNVRCVGTMNHHMGQMETLLDTVNYYSTQIENVPKSEKKNTIWNEGKLVMHFCDRECTVYDDESLSIHLFKLFSWLALQQTWKNPPIVTWNEHFTLLRSTQSSEGKSVWFKSRWVDF